MPPTYSGSRSRLPPELGSNPNPSIDVPPALNLEFIFRFGSANVRGQCGQPLILVNDAMCQLATPRIAQRDRRHNCKVVMCTQSLE